MHSLTQLNIIVLIYVWILNIRACMCTELERMDVYSVNMYSEQHETKQWAFKCRNTENASVTNLAKCSISNEPDIAESM